MEKEWILPVPCQLCAGKYEVERVMGDIDGGVTYRALQDAQAVCLLAYQPEGGSEAERQAAYDTFRADAETLQTFSHANIVKVLDIFEESGVVYVVLPWLEGRTYAAVRAAKIAFGPYQPQVDATKDYLRTLHIEEDKLPTKPYFLFLSDWQVLLVGFGAVRIFDNSLPEEEDQPQPQPQADIKPQAVVEVPQPVLAKSRPVYYNVAPQPRPQPQPQPEEDIKPQAVAEAPQPVTATSRPVYQAALACAQCKRPLPICRCREKGNKH